MLLLGIILLIIGGAMAYFGRPREQLIYFGGVVVFLIGLVFIVIALFNTADANTDAALILLRA